MHDLQRNDCINEGSFPANIDWNFRIVVQIREQGQGIVLYKCKIKGTQQQCFLPLEFRDRYTNNIYVFDA